ncbi:NTP transferase domain-containing protein [Chloroflexi bacterium TSY]|nr:NTP transferase domain-containing protein [Chloroflexi bacterium TSY]
MSTPSKIVAPVGAIIAAAGRSTRMGQAKQLLPWKNHTVIEQVVENLMIAGASPIFVIVGHVIDPIRELLHRTSARIVVNQNYRVVEMLHSYQLGLETMLEDRSPEKPSGALLALGDQPHIPPKVIRQIIDQVQETPSKLIVPSYNMRRGHPLYLPRQLWTDVITLDTNGTLRDVINRNADNIVYINTDTDAVLRDMDTPADYAALNQSDG